MGSKCKANATPRRCRLWSSVDTFARPVRHSSGAICRRAGSFDREWIVGRIVVPDVFGIPGGEFGACSSIKLFDQSQRHVRSCGNPGRGYVLAVDNPARTSLPKGVGALAGGKLPGFLVGRSITSIKDARPCEHGGSRANRGRPLGAAVLATQERQDGRVVYFGASAHATGHHDDVELR